ncbi:unnamed protein product, partial [Prorocentrum cordatum]
HASRATAVVSDLQGKASAKAHEGASGKASGKASRKAPGASCVHLPGVRLADPE